jgi:hypothetical protein
MACSVHFETDVSGLEDTHLLSCYAIARVCRLDGLEVCTAIVCKVQGVAPETVDDPDVSAGSGNGSDSFEDGDHDLILERGLMKL